ncbi:MAG: alanine racemase [Phenylobacterium sp.]|uniref:alanine racemase n=1 Tax=Phenylobacterium sp. TaxID=1871053 RepID=UPI0039191086
MDCAARLTIDLDALAANLGVLRAAAPGAEVAAVVKADGYGLGAGPVAARLWAEGVRSFFVARLGEGEDLRRALGPERPAVIHVLDGLTPGGGERLAAAGLSPVLASPVQVEAAAGLAAALGRALPCALHVDSGMNRQGLTPAEAQALLAARDRLRGLDVRLLMSHLGSATDPADPRNRLQLERFAAVRALFPEAQASFAASAGAFLGPDWRFEQVRGGITLYGGGPEERPDPRLRAVATFEAPILDVRVAPPGEFLGYGSSLQAERPMRLAILGAGYADGLLRAARGGYAWWAGERRPIVFVTMDLTAVEIGEAPARIGDMVELLGPNVAIDDLAHAAGTVAHECLVRLGGRGERVYLGSAD